jgi:hypothetical protein
MVKRGRLQCNLSIYTGDDEEDEHNFILRNSTCTVYCLYFVYTFARCSFLSIYLSQIDLPVVQLLPPIEHLGLCMLCPLASA